MITTVATKTHRPAPLPGQNGAAGDGDKKRKPKKLPNGATNWSQQYYVKTVRHGKEHAKLRTTNGGVVPVDKKGFIAGRQYQCPFGEDPAWYAMDLVFPPACETHKVTMQALDGQRIGPDGDRFGWMFPQVPWDEIWDWGRERFMITGGAGLVGLAGYYVDQTHMPVWGHAVQAAVEVAFVAAAYYSTRKALELRGYKPHGNRAPRLDRNDPERGKGYLELVRRRARTALYGALGLVGWVEFCDALGVSKFVLDDWRGYALAGLLAGVTTVATRPFVRWSDVRRVRRSLIETEAELTSADILPPENTDPTEADGGRAAEEWAKFVAPKLKNTRLVAASYTTVIGGWSIDIAGDVPGAVDVEMFIGESARTLLRLISQTFRVKPEALNFVADDEDVCKVRMLVQPDPPLNEGEVWTPDGTIDVERGVARVGRYADGKPLWEPIIKWGWGVPSKMVLGTTGSGKSENLRKQILIERYAYYVDENGDRRGLFATFLQDFKRYESYGEFKQALPAVGCTVEDAFVMLGALLREMDRRYDMLSSEQWTDDKGRPREGSVKFDPRRGHGPFLSWIIDEFHEIAKNQVFMALIALLSRKMRAAGIRITVGTHLGTLGDMGDRGFRDMLAGGYALLGRTTDALTGIATGGQITGDPRTLPKVPGMCYVADGEAATLLARQSFVPNDDEAKKMGTDKCLYDYLFDDQNNPIGYPAELPEATLNAFGPEWQLWAEAGRRPGMRPQFGPWSWEARALMGEKFDKIEGDAERAGQSDTLHAAAFRQAAGTVAVARAAASENAQADQEEVSGAQETILKILAAAGKPLMLADIERDLRPYKDRGLKCAARSMRDAIKVLCDNGDAIKPTGHGSGGHVITDQGRRRIGLAPASSAPAPASGPEQPSAGQAGADASAGPAHTGTTPDREMTELVMHAAELVVSSQFGSIAMLQRKLRIPFGLACHVMDALASHQAVTPHEDGKARDVLTKPDELEDLLARIEAAQ